MDDGIIFAASMVAVALITWFVTKRWPLRAAPYRTTPSHPERGNMAKVSAPRLSHADGRPRFDRSPDGRRISRSAGADRGRRTIDMAGRLRLQEPMVARLTLVELSTVRQEIRKSRFVATAAPVADEAAAKDFIAARSDPSANHNCWAWRLGQGYRFNDDGEPSGTAGKPILAAIDGQGLDGVAVVVTRWFGGILLGSGGLIRAYGGTAALCLREAGKMTLVETVQGTIACGFGDLTLVQARLGALPGVQLRDQAFIATGAVLSVSVPKDDADGVTRLVTDLTSGRAAIRWDEPG